MKITFNNILNEDTNPRKQKFIDRIVKEMKKYYEGRYKGTHWVDATHGLDLEEIQKYRTYIEDVKRLGDKLKTYDNQFTNVDTLSPRGLRDTIGEYSAINKKYQEALYGVAHLADIFSRSEWDTPNFLENYAVPVSVLLDAWEQFFHDVYTPGKIEHGKTKWGLELEHGLPQGDYGNPIFNGDKYIVFEDKGRGGFILGVDVDWKWRDNDQDFNELYYKRYNSKDEIKRDLLFLEKKELYNDLYGASVDLERNEIDEVVGYLDQKPMDYYHMEAQDDEISVEQVISDYVDRFANYDRGFNMSHGNSDSFTHYYIEYKDRISKFNF